MDAETQYLEIVENILDNGVKSGDRTGTGTISLFGKSINHNYSEGFPLLTTKKMFVRGIITELLWFIRGTEDASFLLDNGVRIWNEWMKEKDGKMILPHTYGVKWRNFDGTDQLQRVIDEIKINPKSRRHVVSAWDPRHIDDAALPWCHVLFQFNVVRDEDKPPDKKNDDGKLGDLSIAVYQRSADFFFLGVPYNIASYSFLLYMICELTNYRPGHMYYTFGDSHIYFNHVEQMKLQLTRKPYDLPKLNVKSKKNIDDFRLDDFEIVGYKSHPIIKGKVSV